MAEWTAADAGRATELLRASLPDERIEDDDVRACLWDDPDPSVVLGDDGGHGVVAAVVRRGGRDPIAHVQAIAVAPEHRRRGIARQLMIDLTEWAVARGSTAMVAGAGAPFYLWPGVDFAWTPALCFFEALGFTDRASAFNMRFADTFRADAPVGVEVRRIVDDADVAEVAAMCATHHPNWSAELERGVQHATAFAAWDGQAPIGFACHSVNRLGWVGPMATDPTRRSGGVGGALLSALAADLAPLGLGMIEVAWVGPASFYAKAAGAEVSRVFRCLSRRIA